MVHAQSKCNEGYVGVVVCGETANNNPHVLSSALVLDHEQTMLYDYTVIKGIYAEI